MAEKRKIRKKKDDQACNLPDNPSKQEYSVAKYLKSKVPCKKTRFLQHAVEYFTSSKAVDALLESPWVNPKKPEDVAFTNREAVTEFLDLMLRHKFFHRAKKLAVTPNDLGPKALKKYKEEEKRKKEERKKKEESEKKETELSKLKSNVTEDKKSDEEKKTEEEKKDVKFKEKKRIKLEMHLEQVFVDGPDAYVWIYDPIPVWYWFAGALLVVGVIALCLFPLWPKSLRKNVYYLSILAAGFLILILGLIALRLVLFCLLWVVTLGQHHLWILPNLTEDVGFVASFWPLYKYEYFGPSSENNKKKKKKEKDSDREESDDEKKELETISRNDISECSDSEASQRTQTGKDFEMVEKEDLTE